MTPTERIARLEILLARVQLRAAVPRSSPTSQSPRAGTLPASASASEVAAHERARSPAQSPPQPSAVPSPAKTIPTTPAQSEAVAAIPPSTQAGSYRAVGGIADVLPELLLDEGPEIILDTDHAEGLEADLGSGTRPEDEPRRLATPVELSAVAASGEIDRSPLAAALVPAPPGPETEIELASASAHPPFDLDLDVSPLSFIPPAGVDAARSASGPTFTETEPSMPAVLPELLPRAAPDATHALGSTELPMPEPAAPPARSASEPARSTPPPARSASEPANAFVPPRGDAAQEPIPEIHAAPALEQAALVQLEGVVAVSTPVTFATALRRSLALRPR
jgi:hypothetical protein